MKTLIVNFKNYPEVLGEGAIRLALALQRVSGKVEAEVIAAPPTPMLGLVAARTQVKVFSQSVASSAGDKTTGSILPEAVKAAGAKGTILNHSESKRQFSELVDLMPRLTSLGMDVCLCSETEAAAIRLASLGSEYVAIEPPELIGSGVAVSKAKPELVQGTVLALRGSGYKGKILCGAGIVTGEDVSKAVELGVDGVLVASSLVKAPDWETKALELANSLT